MKIPSKETIDQGLDVLGGVYEQIDQQIGDELQTRDDKVSDAEVATFLSQRGAKSETAGAAVASFQAYMRHVAQDADVPVAEIKRTLGKVADFVERDRAQDVNVADMKPTWRALTLFCREVKAKDLTASEIVADRSARPVGDTQVHAEQMKTLVGVFEGIGQNYGGGAISVDAVRSYLADGPNTVSTAKEAVRRTTRYLERSTGETEFTTQDIEAAFAAALTALEKNAKGPDDRNKLARTWRTLTAFTDENLVRKKTADSIVGTPVSPTAAPVSDGPKAGTVAAFTALDTDVKAEILEDYGNLHGHYQTTGETSLASLTGAAADFGKLMKRELESIVGDFEDDSGVYGTIGGPSVSVEVISLPSGEVVGGRLWMHQDGFYAEDGPYDSGGDQYYHFDEASEAEALGVDTGADINWQVHGLFEVAPGGGAVQLGGSYEHVSDHWEWSGH